MSLKCLTQNGGNNKVRIAFISRVNTSYIVGSSLMRKVFFQPFLLVLNAAHSEASSTRLVRAIILLKNELCTDMNYASQYVFFIFFPVVL